MLPKGSVVAQTHTGQQCLVQKQQVYGEEHLKANRERLIPLEKYYQRAKSRDLGGAIFKIISLNKGVYMCSVFQMA